jgi:ABC-type antimicrobial peptide transport system permease subunit
MMNSGNIKMALEAIRSSRWRSMLTMLGIIIGIVSVVTIVSLGEGVKQRIVGQIDQAGPDLITIRPGRAFKPGGHNRLTALSLLGTLGGGSLSEADLRTVEATPGVKSVVPFAYVNGVPSTSERSYDDGFVIGTGDGLPRALHQKLQYGEFFAKEDSNREVAVIGRRVAEQLFQENVPIGKLLRIRDQQFVVVGIFEEFDTSPLAPNADYNAAIFIPIKAASKIADNQSKIYQILVRPSDPHAVDQAVAGLNAGLSRAHAGQRDFAVLKSEDTLALATNVLDVLTSFIAGIAAISLIVAGIGILNIMFVSVTERTHEIGIRKAIGATNQQIMGQFLTEAVILSLSGGLLGILFSLLTNYLIRIFTELTPVLTWPIMAIAVGVALSVGIIFGVTPALKAAHKHPIDALREE